MTRYVGRRPIVWFDDVFGGKDDVTTAHERFTRSGR